MIKAVIFDCFGVLINGTFDEVYRQAGGDPNKDEMFINELLGYANLGIITSSEMRDRAVEQIGTTAEKWQDAINSTQLPSEAMLELAAELKKSYMVGILSNANVGTLDRKFSKEQLALFDVVVVSAEVHVMKPDKEIYLLTAEKLGVQPDECVFTDDISGYCQAARLAGMQAIHFQNLKQFKNELSLILDQL